MSYEGHQLLALLRLAIGGKWDVALDGHVDWGELYSLAARHSVMGLAFAGIELMPRGKWPPKKVLLDWICHAETIRKQNLVYSAHVAEFASFMEQHDLDYVVFKGLAVANNYPDTLGNLRQSGDVDFYVPEWDFQKAVAALENNWGVSVKKDKVDKHFSFQRSAVPYEMHYQMETFGCRAHQKYFAKLVDDYIAGGDKCVFELNRTRVARLCPELDIMLVMKHWMTHLLGEGVGLRQTMDLAILVKHYQDRLDVGTLRTHLEAIGYRKAFDAVVALADRYFGVEWPEYDVRSSAFDTADRLMDTIMRNGNFGRADYKYTSGVMRRVETTCRFFRHCMRFLGLAPLDIIGLLPKRVAISIKAHRVNPSVA